MADEYEIMGTVTKVVGFIAQGNWWGVTVELLTSPVAGFVVDELVGPPDAAKVKASLALIAQTPELIDWVKDYSNAGEWWLQQFTDGQTVVADAPIPNLYGLFAAIPMAYIAEPLAAADATLFAIAGLGEQEASGYSAHVAGALAFFGAIQLEHGQARLEAVGWIVEEFQPDAYNDGAPTDTDLGDMDSRMLSPEAGLNFSEYWGSVADWSAALLEQFTGYWAAGVYQGTGAPWQTTPGIAHGALLTLYGTTYGMNPWHEGSKERKSWEKTLPAFGSSPTVPPPIYAPGSVQATNAPGAPAQPGADEAPMGPGQPYGPGQPGGLADTIEQEDQDAAAQDAPAGQDLVWTPTWKKGGNKVLQMQAMPLTSADGGQEVLGHEAGGTISYEPYQPKQEQGPVSSGGAPDKPPTTAPGGDIVLPEPDLPPPVDAETFVEEEAQTEQPKSAASAPAKAAAGLGVVWLLFKLIGGG